MTAGALVLAVEDEPRNTALLEAILQPAGYVLLTAGTLEVAREWLADNRPDIVLLDRHLPDGDGLDLAREVRAEPRLHDVPILLVSASVLPDDQAAAEAAGCDGFHSKPIRIPALLAEVERLIEDGSGG